MYPSIVPYRSWRLIGFACDQISVLPIHTPGHVRKSSSIFRIRQYATITRSPSVLSTLRGSYQDGSTLFDQQLQDASVVRSSSTVPNEEAVYKALKICDDLATALMAPNECPGRASISAEGPTTNLLSVKDRAAAAKVPRAAFSQGKKAKKISEVAYSIAQDPKIFMTQRILELYVRTQNILGQPQSFPHIFDLYASKPIPQPGTSPITFKDSNYRSASAAIPFSLALNALNAAIQVKDLALCLNIIEMTVSAPAFKRSKFIRKALLPVTALTLSPVAAYNIAWQFCKGSDLVDPQTLTNYATVGIMTYVGITVTIGFVALTTSNDQMDRVTWIPGTPLSERWFREEERALIDQVAGAWGLQNFQRRGSEEGQEWEDLRNWIFSRGMYLDKPELMEGME